MSCFERCCRRERVQVDAVVKHDCKEDVVCSVLERVLRQVEETLEEREDVLGEWSVVGHASRSVPTETL